MTKKDLIFFREWFDEYTKTFISSNEEDRKNIKLKIEHSLRVAENIVKIAGSLSLNANEVLLAETVGLFHDLGRFPQYALYKTFQDRKSVNHGLFGTKVLLKENVLDRLPDFEKDLIIKSVKFHGTYTIPNIFGEKTRFFLKLIRDADKVDIYRVFIEYYESPEEDRASATAFGVPNSPEYSKAMLSCIMQKKIASYSFIKTENDFRIMQLSWLYDIHFDESVRLIRQRNYINKITNKLPQTEEVISAINFLNKFIDERLKGDG
jgi:HD superfamily phosphohydrolase YqeK